MIEALFKQKGRLAKRKELPENPEIELFLDTV